jgi:hypothetical protein
MPTNVNQNILDTAAGLEAMIVTETGRGGACHHTICLVILHPSETLTTSNSLHQVLCSLPDIIADAARA